MSAGTDGVSKSENAMAVHFSITEAIPKKNEMAQKFVQRNEVDMDTMVPSFNLAISMMKIFHHRIFEIR